MKVRFDLANLNRDITVPRPVSRQKSYKSLLGQASTSENSSCGSSTRINNRIDEEEGEDNEMVLGGPSDVLEARAATSQTRSNGENWLTDRDEYDSDKDEEEDTSQDPVVNEIGPQLPGLYDNYHPDDNLPTPGIIVTVISPSDDDLSNPTSGDSPSTSHQDNQLLMELRVREYQGNFDGFAEINRFSTIDDMHEFIVCNSEPTLTNEPSPRQDLYLDILLNERGENRFDRLVDISKGTVRRVLIKNEHIFRKLYSTASMENFPSPLKEIMDEETADLESEDVFADREDTIVDTVEENMKRWYMIEMIGMWLKFISDVKSYREAIKKSVLKANCGIENDRCEGIAVPLKYK